MNQDSTLPCQHLAMEPLTQSKAQSFKPCGPMRCAPTCPVGIYRSAFKRTQVVKDVEPKESLFVEIDQLDRTQEPAPSGWDAVCHLQETHSPVE